MPAEPLVDLASLDLSRVVVSKEEIYSQLKQSGRFALLDGLLHHDYERELVIGFMDVRADAWWAEDHIPGRPILPGALMIEAAAQTSSFDFYQRKPEARELFCGFTREPGHGPTRYPVACEPQAWSAGVVFHLVTGMLGLVPSAADNRLTLDRPALPPWLRWLEVHDLRLGKSRVTLRAAQGREGAAIELLRREGDAEIVVKR